MDFNFEELFVKYWWVFLIILIGILLYIYSKLDAYTKIKLKKIFNKKTILIIVFFGGWYLWYKYGETMTIANANHWMPIFLLLVLAGYNYIGNLKYNTQQIVCVNGFHGCYSKPPRRKNGFLIFAIDSFNYGGLSWDYAGRVLVVREETVELCDEGAVCLASPTFASKYELDPEVEYFIDNDKFLKGGNKSVYYGWFDDLNRIDYDFEQLEILKKEGSEIYGLLKKELGVDNPKVSTLYWVYRNVCKAVNKQTEYYDSTVEAVEKGVEHHKRVKDAYVERDDRTQQKMEGHEEY